MFIVAVTLGLLAAMGLYGLSATASDIRSAAHMREALQGQKAGEDAMMVTGETLNAAGAYGIYKLMMSGPGNGQSTNCKTAAPYTGNSDTAAAEACVKLDPTELRTLQATVNPWPAGVDLFTDKSFGNVANLPAAAPYGPFISVELTNPVPAAPPPGNDKQQFAQVTVTVFVEIKTAAAVPADTLVVGRSRMTVGPIGTNGANGAPQAFP
jgi:hypothetical protein